MKKELLITILSALLILLFFYSGFSKLFGFADFMGSMRKQGFPHWMEALLTWTLPAVEIITALLLLLNKTRLIGFYASSVMMIAFTVYVFLGFANIFERVPCTCGGVIKSFTWSQHFVFNVFFLLVALLGTILERKSRRLGYLGKHAIAH